MEKNYYITTPIYYVNGEPHIGHAYTTLAADVLSRFKRLDGYNVRFHTGTDEFGQKIEESANKNNIDVHDWIDQNSQRFRDLFDAMNMQYDHYMRTSYDYHIKSVQAIWQKMLDNGYIYKGQYAGWYATSDEAFVPESEIITKEDGTKVAPSGSAVKWLEEESYFFKLSEFSDKLLKHIEDNPDFIRPKSRRNEVVAFINSDGGLRDLSISRSTFSWGVPVPNDESHVIYVWLDALSNYITALGYPEETTPEYQNFWTGQGIHIIAKDILRFHAIYWPAFLMSLDLPLPKHIFSHGWWTNNGEKISKSKGNQINPLDLMKEYGLDQTRFFLMRDITFGGDGDFSDASMQRRVNELSNDLGNLGYRVLSMVYKHCNNAIPAYDGDLDSECSDFIKNTDKDLDIIRNHMDNYEIHNALEHIWVMVRAANSWIDAQAPWALRKTDINKMNHVLYALCEVIKRILLLLQPFMPDSIGKILTSMNVSDTNFTGYATLLVPGNQINKPEIVFTRYEG